jgi:hypothetical protein
MRTVYRLLGVVRRYGAGPVEAACSTALDLDVISIAKIEAMLAKATETTSPALPIDPPAPGARFARDPAEYALSDPARKGTGTANDRPGTANSGTGTASQGTSLVVIDGAAAEVSA